MLAKAWYVYDLEGFLAHFVANSQYADAVARLPMIALNTDDRTALEYNFAKTVGQLTPFSIEALREKLMAAGYHQPSVGPGIDWRQVEIRRQLLNAVMDGELSYALLSKPEDHLLVDAFYKYRARDFAGAVELWPAEHRKPSDVLLGLLLARAYAELGRPECLDLIAAAEPNYPIDASAVRAIYYCHSGNMAQAAQSMDSFFSQLQGSPWAISVISDSVFKYTMDVATSDPAAAKRLYTLLSRPFASHRFNDIRQRARIL